MTKLKKGGKVFPIIYGDDVIVKGETTVEEAFENVEDTLDEHKKEIDKLKSNLKYVYSYGGVGGKGSGGSGGGGGQTGTPTLFVTLGGHPLQADSSNAIILNKPGKYYVEGNLSNSNGETFFVKAATVDKWNYAKFITLNALENNCEFSQEVNLTDNGEIRVELYKLSDSRKERIGIIQQNFIVKPHTFDVKFKYKFNDGTSSDLKEGVFNEPYEYFMGDTTYLNPFIDISFKINLQNVSNVVVEYSIGSTDANDDQDEKYRGQGIKRYDTADNLYEPFTRELYDLTVGGEPLISDKNIGGFKVKVTLKYDANGVPADPDVREFIITLIPNKLYINVRNPENVIYDTEEELIEDMTEGIPSRCLNVGTWTSFFYKVYEGEMKSNPKTYSVDLNVYDKIDSEYSSTPSKTITTNGILEQTETKKSVDIAFDSPGIKKLVFTTQGQKPNDVADGGPIVKYVFVKPMSDEAIDWYPQNVDQVVFYFRAHEGFSSNFPRFQEGTDVLEMMETGNPLSLYDDAWGSIGERNTTIISFGMQYSAVNVDHAEILRIYSTKGDTDPAIVLYSDKIFSKNICIPPERKYNASVNNQYHLVQIVKHRIEQGVYATYLYIDGKLEANNKSTNSRRQFVGEIRLMNVNAIYNLISLQYVNLNVPSVFKTNYNEQVSGCSVEQLIYQNYLAYKDRMGAGTVTDAEQILLENIDSIKFDGEDVVVSKNFVSTISPYMPIPTMMFEYKNQTGTGDISDAELEQFKNNLFAGYRDAGSEAFGNPFINLYWSTGNNSNSINKELILIPDPKKSDGIFEYIGYWRIKLQGTSTMRNKIKNFSLFADTIDTDGKYLLMSPNYDPNDSSTFLPEMEWTIKADIADSAHANNTAIGRFVNTVCTPFINNNGQNPRPDIKPFIKNTLDGFPILMYFKIGDKVYYLGVYNFNMGRESHYNLGYHTNENMEAMVDAIEPITGTPFSISLGSANPSIPNLVVGEIQDNNPEFDFHQCDPSVLFAPTDGATGRATMFGPPKKLKGTYSIATDALAKFVKSVAQAGGYCFANIGKTPVSSKMDGESTDCIERYKGWIDENTGEKHEEVPDLHHQFKYEGASTTKVWYETTEPDMSFNELAVNDEMLLKCIWPTKSDGRTPHDQGYYNLEYTSISEYYTICMAFGMVDSILKNMNMKSWDAQKFFVAFYDMDCGLEENNAGEEVISYLAATDYWYSRMTANNELKEVEILYDYWPNQKDDPDGFNKVGVGFDFTSSYLFAIAKYAYPILATKDIKLNNYPQQFWAKLRRPENQLDPTKTGELCNADYFINKYFSSGIGQVPSYLATMNYQVKYLYTGEYYDADDNIMRGPLANESSFNGSRLEKVRNWLNRRLHFLDVVFNVQGIEMPIGGGYNMPTADEGILIDTKKNPDVVITNCAFSTDNKKEALMKSNGIPISIYAPQNTPLIVQVGTGKSSMYILNAQTGSRNVVNITAQQAQAIRMFGSQEFTDVSTLDPILTKLEKIVSNNLTSVKIGSYLSYDFDLTIDSTSVKEIIMNSPALSGNLSIEVDELKGKAIHTIDISTSGLSGSWSELTNLKNLNISSVSNKDAEIYVSGSPLLTGERCNISGTSEKPTTLPKLTLAGVSGNFDIKNTSISEMYFSVPQDKTGEIKIVGDKALNTLTLSGFSKVEIRNCPNLETLQIQDPYDRCTSIIIDIPYDYVPEEGMVRKYLMKFNSDTEGVFDFTRYKNLETLGVSGTRAVVIKIPNRKVSVESFKNNEILEFIDTAGKYSVIELTKQETFYNCPHYGMRQSWWPRGNGDTDITTLTNPNDVNIGIYTKMCIGSSCTSLANTFFKRNANDKSIHIDEVYFNTWGQKVKNATISANEAVLFINTYVSGIGINDAYIGDGDSRYTNNELNIIYDNPSQNRQYSDGIDHQPHITSLYGCFNGQDGISYNGELSASLPDLSKYTSLVDISNMYYDTSVKCLSAKLLSLPPEKNNNDPDNYLNWTYVIRATEMKILKDAFKNISYRISSLSSMRLTVYDDNNTVILNYGELNPSGENGGYLDFVSLLWPHKSSHPEDPTYEPTDYDDYDHEAVYETDDPDASYSEYIPFTRLTSFNSFNVDPGQWVDYRRLFKFCPNVTNLTRFLKCDLTRVKIDKLLQPCENLTTIMDSFDHDVLDNVSSLTPINLFEFFNWTAPNSYNKVTRLFESDNANIPGFSVNKYISFADFQSIMEALPKYNISRLTNLFSNCTINGYDSTYEIVVGETENDTMPDVRAINALFYKCKTDDGSPLRIRRSFFKKLPNVTAMANTFYGVYFDHMLSYDFFCKRIPENETALDNVYLDSACTTSATLKTTKYREDYLVGNMYCCFRDAKFKSCDCWFDPTDAVNNGLAPFKDVVNGNPAITTYYKMIGTRPVEYTIKDPVAISDTRNNFTNYVPRVTTTIYEQLIISNHDIEGDMMRYDNTANNPYEVVKATDGITDLNLYPTFCCLPPDILHGCTRECNLNMAFANTNIIGVIPQHLLMKCYSSELKDMLMNVNILPNVIYHYNKNTADDANYLDLISGIESDNTTIGQPTSVDDSTVYEFDGDVESVLFRNSNGELRKRKPFVGEYNKSQFVYVPQGYVINANLQEAFTFRYNLPQQVDLVRHDLEAQGLIWPSAVDDKFDYTYSPEGHPELWPYYTQYFFMVDESIDWSQVTVMKNLFISDTKDTDFYTRHQRILYTPSREDTAEPNRWWYRPEDDIKTPWTSYTEGVLNCFLNLCGERDRRTGIIEDSGILVTNAKNANKTPKLDGIVSGNLVVFLNGKVFDDGVDAINMVSPTYCDSSIILYSADVGRNIVFPRYGTPANPRNAPKLILAFNGNTAWFYHYMFPDATSLKNYKDVFGLIEYDYPNPNFSSSDAKYILH